MKNETRNGVIALLLVVAVAFLVIAGSGILTGERWYNIKVDDGNTAEEGRPSEVLDASGHEGIRNAQRYLDDNGGTQGYQVTVLTDGYGGPITMNVEFDASGSTVLGLHILEHEETEGVGSKITDEDYSKQFIGVRTPLGLALDMGEVSLADGTYEARSDKPRDGYTDVMTMTVEDGRITGAAWDEIGEDGSSKRHLSDLGEYQMTEEGLTWREQADALAAALIENQDLEFLSFDEAGKTDAVAGVSISVNGFVHMAEECFRQAGGGRTLVDGISGATISSGAVVDGINRAAAFVQEAA